MIGLNTIPETKACENCAKAKRKCGKELPGCHRCTSRGLQCVYQPARPTSFVRLQDPSDVDDLPHYQQQYWDPNILFTPVSDFDVPLIDCPAGTHDLQSSLQPPARIPTPPRKHLDCEWFLSPETWKSPESHPLMCPGRKFDHNNDEGSSPPVPVSALKQYLKVIQCTSADWVTRGSNDFIHSELYTFRNPRCIQDAQTAYALYLARTDHTEDAVFRTLHARATQLLRDEEKHNTWSSHDVFSHLARCQALLTYQIIGLMDGDIHLRGAAEERIEVLKTWLEQLLESTTSAATFCFGGGASGGGTSSPSDPAAKRPPSAPDIANVFGIGTKALLSNDDLRTDCRQPLRPAQQEQAVWRLWLFAESVRRTWIVTSGLQASFQALKTGWGICLRSMKLTAGQGMWDAPTCYAWERRCSKGDVFFLEGWDLDSLFTRCRPEEVDDFAKRCMDITWGVEKMQRWKDSTTV